MKERTVSHLLYRLLGMSSVSGSFIYGWAGLKEESEILNWPCQAGERAIGRKRSPQAILKLLGRTLPLMTGLQGLLGLSGFVMNSTTWLGLLFPSELYAATWREGGSVQRHRPVKSLVQGWATGGPGATCGPHLHLMRPSG